MEPYLPLVLTLLVTCSVASVTAILLRLPLKLLDHGTRLSAVETELAAQASNVRKALRRIGIEEKASKKASTTRQPELPFAVADQEDPEDPLDYAARIARINGSHARRRGR